MFINALEYDCPAWPKRIVFGTGGRVTRKWPENRPLRKQNPIGFLRQEGFRLSLKRRRCSMSNAPSGAPLAAVYQPLNEHLEVFVIDATGALNVIWKEHNNNWNPPF